MARNRKHPVTTIKAHPLAWAKALEPSDNEPRRLRVLEDGAVLVLRRG
jgi:hypothetical protein